MKKNILVIVSIIIFLAAILFFLFPIIKYKIRIKNVEEQLLKFYNLEFADGVSKSIEFDYIKQEPPCEYNITQLVNYYILQLNNVKNGEKGNADIWKNERLMIPNSYYIQQGFDYSWYVDNNNIDYNYVKKELEKKLHYINNEWIIPIEADNIIELTGKYYISYEKRKFEKNDNVKKVLSIHFFDKVDFDSKEYKEKAYNIIVTYLDKNNKKQKEKRFVAYNYIDKLWHVGLNGFYFNNKGPAEITLHHHNYDKEKEEEQKRMDEEMAEYQKMMQEYEANLSDEERYFNPAAGN